MTGTHPAPSTCSHCGESEVVPVLRGLPLPHSRCRACDRRFAGGRPVPIDPGR